MYHLALEQSTLLMWIVSHVPRRVVDRLLYGGMRLVTQVVHIILITVFLLVYLPVHQTIHLATYQIIDRSACPSVHCLNTKS